jgi:hypothetical protein
MLDAGMPMPNSVDADAQLCIVKLDHQSGSLQSSSVINISTILINPEKKLYVSCLAFPLPFRLCIFPLPLWQLFNHRLAGFSYTALTEIYIAKREVFFFFFRKYLSPR